MADAQTTKEAKPRKQYAKRKTTVVHRDIAGRIAARIPADQDPAPILSQYLTEARTSDIAAQWGVTRQALNMWLLDKAEEAWKKAQVARAVSRKESAEEELEDAKEPLSLARAREKLRGAQWDLERVFHRIYGQKQEVTHTGTVTVSNALQTISERRLAQLDGHVAPQLTQSNIIDVQEIAR